MARYYLRRVHAKRRRSGSTHQARPLTLVVDASVAVAAALARDGFNVLGEEPLLAPPLMWSEARSALHEMMWRREISPADAEHARRQLEDSTVRPRTHARLGDETWRLADAFGWAKTYDAEYIALAHLLRCRLVTLDGRLRRATERLGFVVGPTEI